MALNRAVAVAEVDGPAAALADVDRLDLDGYHLFHATRADLLRRLGRHEEAARGLRRRPGPGDQRRRAPVPGEPAGRYSGLITSRGMAKSRGAGAGAGHDPQQPAAPVREQRTLVLDAALGVARSHDLHDVRRADGDRGDLDQGARLAGRQGERLAVDAQLEGVGVAIDQRDREPGDAVVVVSGSVVWGVTVVVGAGGLVVVVVAGGRVVVVVLAMARNTATAAGDRVVVVRSVVVGAGVEVAGRGTVTVDVTSTVPVRLPVAETTASPGRSLPATRTPAETRPASSRKPTSQAIQPVILGVSGPACCTLPLSVASAKSTALTFYRHLIART